MVLEIAEKAGKIVCTIVGKGRRHDFHLLKKK
jgi:hypothetical protein